jgi:N-dimethylarginine dimethylaminohydrolase
VFNILNEKFALVYQEGMDKKSLEYLSTQFELIPISKEEQETMGTNILSIGNKKVVSLSSQKRINELLKAHGFTILENDFSEIIKSGGSFRCCTFPIERN